MNETEETPQALLVEYAVEPLAIGVSAPRFTWEVPFEGRERGQSAYRIMVASSEGRLEQGCCDLWDSGRVVSSQSVNVRYEGSPLHSNMDCWWRVEIWDESGEVTRLSRIQHFGTGIFDASEWKAKWIGMGLPDEPQSDPDSFMQDRMSPEIRALEPDLRSPLLRKGFALDRPVRRARVFVYGCGFFELYLNGRKVGDEVLVTPRTEFRKRLLYSTYDVTAQLEEGSNALGLILGNGWYNTSRKYWAWAMPWYGSPRAIVKLHVEYADGEVAEIVSDESWRGNWSPIISSCIYDGEVYDARLELGNWCEPGFDDSDWITVNCVRAPGGTLQAASHEANRVVERFKPVGVQEIAPGRFIFDMGRNMTGWVRLSIPGGIAGQMITLRYAEEIYSDGSLDCSTAGAALQEDRYIMRGAPDECYEPRFTYHGFQYLELTGFPGIPTLDDIEACFVHSDVQQTGHFECGNSLINRIHRCTVQTQLCNLQMGIVTDDTQRAERLGWCDCWESAVETYYNFSMPRIWNKWIGDYRDQQDEHGMVGYIVPLPSPGEDLVWSASLLLIPWWQYLYCGDRLILEDNYETQKKYVAYLEKTGVREIGPNTTAELDAMLRWKCPVEDRFPAEADRGHLQLSYFGDHLAVCEGASGFCKNQPLSIATAFYYQIVSTLARIAVVLGKIEDAEQYTRLADKIKNAFNERFLNSSWGYYDTGSQNAQAWPLAFGLVPTDKVGMVASYLNSSVNFRQGSLTTGLAGTKYAIEAIAMSGRNDIVWKRAIATDYPSWGYMLRNPKRTTMAENWLGKASLCHANLGAAIDEWFYWGLLGIRPDESAPGFEKIVLKPYLPPDLPWAKGSLVTPRGKIVSSWRHENGLARWEIGVPANCSATVHVPASASLGITESGTPAEEAKGVHFLRRDQDESVFRVASGTYRFEFQLSTSESQ